MSPRPATVLLERLLIEKSPSHLSLGSPHFGRQLSRQWSQSPLSLGGTNLPRTASAEASWDLEEPLPKEVTDMCETFEKEVEHCFAYEMNSSKEERL